MVAPSSNSTDDVAAATMNFLFTFPPGFGDIAAAMRWPRWLQPFCAFLIWRGNPRPKQAKVQHWRASRGKNARKAAPVLDFLARIDPAPFSAGA